MQDPAEWFGGVARVMFVHAHPDDESIGTGGTLAGLSAAGREPLLVTLTRGEQGEVMPGPFSQLQGTEDLAPHRQAELAAALFMLGVERHVFLGVEPARAEGLTPIIYEDSGMEWGPDGRAMAAPTAGRDALTNAPVVEALNDLLAAANEAGAGAIVSYDNGGGYGHPDHVLAHRLGRAVAHALGIPFWEIVSDEKERAAIALAANASAADASAADASDTERNEDLDLECEVHDIEPWLDRKIAALRAHVTQLSVEEDEIVHVGGQRQPIDRLEMFRLLTPPM